jgi:hypothetical protein
MWPKPGFLGLSSALPAAGFTKNYALACFDRGFDPASIPLRSLGDCPKIRPRR